MLKVTEHRIRQYTKLTSLCKAVQADTDCEETFIHIMALTVVLFIFIMHIVQLCFCSQPNMGQNSMSLDDLDEVSYLLSLRIEYIL